MVKTPTAIIIISAIGIRYSYTEAETARYPRGKPAKFLRRENQRRRRRRRIKGRRTVCRFCCIRQNNEKSSSSSSFSAIGIYMRMHCDRNASPL